jgi:hypothetical protein
MDPRLEVPGIDVSLHASHKADIEFPDEPHLSLLTTAIREFWSRSLSLKAKPSRAGRAKPTRKLPKKPASSQTRK